MTDSDKNWLSEQLGAVKALLEQSETRSTQTLLELKQSLLELESRLNQRFENLLDRRLEALESRFDERIVQSETRMRELIERVETSLLTEFHKWASPMEARMRAHTAILRAIDLDKEHMDERLRKLEGRDPGPN